MLNPETVPTAHPLSTPFRQIRVRILDITRYVETLRIDVASFGYSGYTEIADSLREDLGRAEQALKALKSELMV